MTARTMRVSDVPALLQMAETAGFPYPDLAADSIESVCVVEDDDGRIVMACAAERIVQLYLYAGDGLHPAAKLYAIRLLHDAMKPELWAKGYREVNAFLPPTMKAFGRRLERSFGWKANWPSWCKLFCFNPRAIGGRDHSLTQR